MFAGTGVKSAKSMLASIAVPRSIVPAGQVVTPFAGLSKTKMCDAVKSPETSSNAFVPMMIWLLS